MDLGEVFDEYVVQFDDEHFARCGLCVHYEIAKAWGLDDEDTRAFLCKTWLQGRKEDIEGLEFETWLDKLGEQSLEFDED